MGEYYTVQGRIKVKERTPEVDALLDFCVAYVESSTGEDFNYFDEEGNLIIDTGGYTTIHFRTNLQDRLDIASPFLEPGTLRYNDGQSMGIIAVGDTKTKKKLAVSNYYTNELISMIKAIKVKDLQRIAGIIEKEIKDRNLS